MARSTSSPVVPDAATELANRYSADTRTLNYFVLNATSLPSIAEPTDADLAAYLKDHQADYRTKETRTVDLMALSPTSLAAGKTIADDVIAAEYERTKANLIKLEKRDIKQVVLSDAQSTAFDAGQKAGKSFDDLVKEAGLTVSDLGSLTKAAITDSTLATTAFGLKQGDFAIIPGIQGKRAVTVTAIEPGGQISLADAKADIAKQLALKQATTEVGDDVDQIEDLRAGNQLLGAIAPRYKLTVTPVTLTADGTELSAVPGIIEADRTRVAQAIFTAKQGAITPSVSLTGNQTLWFDLKSVAPARDQTLAEVHDAVAAAWTKQKTDDVAGALNQFPIISQPITRQGDKSTGGATTVLDAGVAQAAFDGGAGHYGYAIDSDGDYVIFQVAAITPATGTLSDQTKTAVLNSVRDSQYGDFITALRQDDGLRINQGALNQVLALDPNGN